MGFRRESPRWLSRYCCDCRAHPHESPRPSRLGGPTLRCSLALLATVLRGPPSPRRPAPSSPARISNLAGHRVSPASLAERVGLKGAGRSLHPGRRKDRNEVRTAASVPRARRAGPRKTSQASLPVPGWRTEPSAVSGVERPGAFPSHIPTCPPFQYLKNFSELLSDGSRPVSGEPVPVPNRPTIPVPIRSTVPGLMNERARPSRG